MSGTEPVLITGFSGFRGRRMARYLLAREPSALVYVLVHDKFASEAEAELASLPPEHRSRVIPLQGDATSIDLGLSGKEYRELASRVKRVFHFAQVVYPGATRKLAEAVNIAAMREVLELGRACHSLECLLVASSALVSGQRTGLVLEDELGAGQSFRNPVQETLARAERLARAAMVDLPVAVVRPSQIVGDSVTGEIDRFGGPYLLILLILNSPQDFPVLLPARGDAPMNVAPIDFVTAAAHRIATTPAALGRTFHLTDPRPLSVRQMYQLVAAAGGRRLAGGFIPSRVTKALLSAPGVHLLSRSPRAFIDAIATPVWYDTRNTDAILRGSGLACPPLESYIEVLVDFVQERLRTRRAKLEEEAIHDPLA